MIDENGPVGDLGDQRDVRAEIIGLRPNRDDGAGIEGSTIVLGTDHVGRVEILVLLGASLIEGDKHVAVLQLADARVGFPMVGTLINRYVFGVLDRHVLSFLPPVLQPPQTRYTRPSKRCRS